MPINKCQVFLCLCLNMFTKPVKLSFIVGSKDNKTHEYNELDTVLHSTSTLTGSANEVFSVSNIINTTQNGLVFYKKHKISGNSSTAFDLKQKLIGLPEDQNGLLINDTAKQDLLHPEVNQRSTREVAFKVTTPEDHPYAVILFIFDKSKYLGCCSGSLLTLEWVLTAASHCFNLDGSTVTHVEVYAGGNSEKEWLEKRYPLGYQPRFFVHSEYSRDEHYVSYYDVALVKVDPFVTSSTVSAVELYTKPWAFHDYVNCTLTGFGKHQFYESRTDDFVRRTYYLEAKSPCPCLNTSRTKPRHWICSKPKQEFGICGSDWGAALVCDKQVRALAVVVISYKNLQTCTKNVYSEYICAQNNSLSVFQNTFPCIKWMNYYIKEYVEISKKPPNAGPNLQPGILHFSIIIFNVIIGQNLRS